MSQESLSGTAHWTYEIDERWTKERCGQGTCLQEMVVKTKGENRAGDYYYMREKAR